jgi:predicted RNase H-like HicB family nuclease
MVDVSETYTAVYARDGEEWVARISEAPGVESRAGSVGEVRQQIRDALARHVTTAPAELHVVDQFSLPTQFQAVQNETRATRTEAERAAMAASMTASRTAKEWAADLQLSERAPGAVQWLGDLEGELDVDQMCFAITVAEEMGRWGDGETGSEAAPAEEVDAPGEVAGGVPPAPEP